MPTIPGEDSWELCAAHAQHAPIVKTKDMYDWCESVSRLHDRAKQQLGVGTSPPPGCVLCKLALYAIMPIPSPSTVGLPLAFGGASIISSPQPARYQHPTSGSLSRASSQIPQAPQHQYQYTSVGPLSGYQSSLVEDSSACSALARATEVAGKNDSWTKRDPQVQELSDSDTEDKGGHYALTRTMSGAMSEHSNRCSMPSPESSLYLTSHGFHST